MTDIDRSDRALDAAIDRGVAAIVERDAPDGQPRLVRTRVEAADAVAMQSRWRWPALATVTALVIAATTAGVWVLWERRTPDVLETRRATSTALPGPAVRPASAGVLRPREPAAGRIESLVTPAPTAHALRAAREAEASRARLLAFLDALHRLPPEVLRDRPAADEPLPEPEPIVIPEIVIQPLDVHASPESDDPSGDLSPR